MSYFNFSVILCSYVTVLMRVCISFENIYSIIFYYAEFIVWILLCEFLLCGFYYANSIMLIISCRFYYADTYLIDSIVTIKLYGLHYIKTIIQILLYGFYYLIHNVIILWNCVMHFILGKLHCVSSIVWFKLCNRRLHYRIIL